MRIYRQRRDLHSHLQQGQPARLGFQGYAQQQQQQMINNMNNQ
jgi:hypothetical protein